jgi:hypothetical protein
MRLLGYILSFILAGHSEIRTGAFRAQMKLAETHAWPLDVKECPLFEDFRKDARFNDFCQKEGISTI